MKNFIKPTKMKIAIFAALALIACLGGIAGWGFCKECNPKPFLYDLIPTTVMPFLWLGNAIALYPITLLKSILYSTAYCFGIYGLDLDLAFIPITAIYLYALACTIEWAYTQTRHTQ